MTISRLFALGAVTLTAWLTPTEAVAQPPKVPMGEPTNINPADKDYGTRPVAYIHGNIAVTRAQLAEFLIARGGYDKLELLVNKIIIEMEAKKRNITVTPQEMEAAFQADLKISNPPVRKEDFINLILPKYGKTYYEWMEDVVRPRLMLGKMCQDRVKVSDADLLAIYERDHGEKRAVKIIIWPKGDSIKSIQDTWDQIRKSETEFDRAARTQANPSLASTGGEIKPIARNQITDEKDVRVEQIAFGLREGEVSQIFETNQGYMVMKLLKIVPPDGVAFEKVKEAIHREAFDLKLTAEIPKFFSELNKAANPNMLLNGPPNEWRFDTKAKDVAAEVQKQLPPVQPASATAPKK